MQKRFPHYLRPLGKGSWPQAIICVDAVSEIVASETQPNVRTERLTRWYATLLVRQKDTYVTRYNADCSSAVEWWATLARTLEHTQSTWLVSYRACRVWALLGLWEELENGKVVLVETHSETCLRKVRGSSSGGVDCHAGETGWPGSNVRKMLAQSSGYLVAENPPNILRARIAMQARWFQWIDLRNYGVEIADDNRPEQQRLASITNAVQSISSALHTYKMGGLRATAGSQALAGYRSGYYGGGIYCHNDKQSLALESSAYYGGRCEVRHIGVCEGTVTHLDFRSLYPYCCVDCMLPVRLIAHKQSEGRLDIETGDSGIGTIAEVDLQTDEPAYPYRRHYEVATNAGRNVSGDSGTTPVYDTDIIYPVGRFKTVLAGPELNDALGRGRVKRVHQLALYEMEYALRDYALAMYSMRTDAESTADYVVAHMAKQLSVCLPGKFGQKLRIWEYEPNVVAHVPYGEWWGGDHTGRSVRYRSIGWTVWRDRILGWSQEAAPSIAAWITSAGRVKLLSAIRIAGWDNVYYYDTDSLFVNEVGYGNLTKSGSIGNRTLGKLSFQGKSEYASYNGIKDYSFGDTNKSAGTPKGYYADAGDGQHFWYNRSPSSEIRRGRKPDGLTVLGRYFRDGEYRHGVVHDDGHVTPFVLDEW